MSDLTVEQAREKVKLERSRLWLWINAPMEHAEKALDALIAAAEAQGRAEERERCAEVCDSRSASLHSGKQIMAGLEASKCAMAIRSLSSPETLAAIDAGIVAAREGRVTPMTFVDHVSPTTEGRDAG